MFNNLELKDLNLKDILEVLEKVEVLAIEANKSEQLKDFDIVKEVEYQLEQKLEECREIVLEFHKEIENDLETGWGGF